jgi:nicotinate-nucleotide adenylyltransferase
LSGQIEKKKFGIFGGTFDPPHLGHMILAQEALYQLNLSQIFFVLTANPPHKQGHIISPVKSRLKLLQAAIKDNSNFALSMVDIDRPPPYYSIDTVKILANQYKNAIWIYLMGADSLVDLPKWHDPVGFVRECDGLGVVKRPEFQIDLEKLDQSIPGIKAKVQFIDTPLLEIASSEIRFRVRNSLPYKYFVLPAVHEMIVKLKLYYD